METLRVDATILSTANTKTVRVIGQLKSLNGDNSGTIDSNGVIKINSSVDLSNMKVGHWYEVIGVVKHDDLSINVFQFFDFGDDEHFNEKAAMKLIDVVHRIPELYYS